MASSSTWLIISSTSSSVSLSSLAIGKNPFLQMLPLCTPKKTRLFPIMVASSTNDGPLQKSTKLVTFLGKGGSGKTTSSVFAAQHYAMAGLKTCLVIQSQDPTAEYLLNCKLGVSPITCTDNLSAVRLETSKMLLDPLNRLKQADARLNMTQGVFEGVVGEELGVLPGMDSIFSALALERLVGFFARNAPKDNYDVIVYDGLSTEELIRVFGTASKARLYLKYLRNLAEKTDLGRLAGPSLLRLAEEAGGLSSRGSNLDGKRSAEIWDELDQTLERGSSVFTDASKFGCYLVVDPNNSASVNSAFRYWGCAIQAGAQVSGVLGHASTDSFGQSIGILQKSFSPLPCSLIGSLSVGSPPNWKEIMRDNINKGARGLISGHNNNLVAPSVKFDHAKKSVTLLMPGFDKSEIKLYQYRGGSELLVEAGDQRRVIRLPPQIQGKVAGAKFTERSIVVTMR